MLAQNLINTKVNEDYCLIKVINCRLFHSDILFQARKKFIGITGGFSSKRCLRNHIQLAAQLRQ